MAHSTELGVDEKLRDLQKQCKAFMKRHENVAPAVVRQLVPPNSVKDVLQDIHLAIWKAHLSGSLPKSGKEVPWLAVVARNICHVWQRNRYRRRERESLTPSGVAQLSPVVADDRSSQVYASRDELRNLLDFVATLGTEKAQCFFLKEVLGCTIQETSEALNISFGAARHRIDAVQVAILTRYSKAE